MISEGRPAAVRIPVRASRAVKALGGMRLGVKDGELLAGSAPAGQARGSSEQRREFLRRVERQERLEVGSSHLPV